MSNESEALFQSDEYDGVYDDTSYEPSNHGRSRYKSLNESIEAPKGRNTKAKVGESCRCPICHKVFIKRSYQQRFCGNRCRIKYHNKRQFYY